jgi:lipopolysaccharide cholinephosphotransferase
MDFSELFPDEREKGKTISRQCQMVMLRMLKILDFLCRKHNISYFLTGGTLLGAIRHQGFIPWDDDLDVGMTRNNYEKFLKRVVPELPGDIFFQNDETDTNYPSCHIIEAKLRDKYSSYGNSKDWHNGLQIDISIYDRAYLPHNFFIYLLNRSLIFFFKKKGDKRRAQILKSIEKFSPFPLVYSNSFIHGWKMIRLGTNYFTQKEISKLLEVRFEDVRTFIPVGWKGYLSRRYDNYMELPVREEQRGMHSDSVHYSDVNHKKFMSKEKVSIINEPDPFKPCNHVEILYWKDKN